MSVLEQMQDGEHEQIVFFNDNETKLKVIVAIHNTNLGPALGGTRFWNYKSEDDALYDVLRLSRGMSLKNAAAGLPLGGGKAVIIGDPQQLKSERFFRAYGRLINRLGGLYYTAEDVNTNEHDMDLIRTETNFVVGLSNKSANPSPATARGIYQGIIAAVEEVFGVSSVEGLRIAVSGLGSVGYDIAQRLHSAGAKLIVADINPSRVDKAQTEFNAKVVDPSKILFEACDIFVPCALGGVINRDNALHLQCKIIAGSANNVLVDSSAGDIMDQAGILYVPDYIINAGGVINAATEITGENAPELINARVNNIYNTVKTVIEKAKSEKIPTYKAADVMALEIINRIKKR